MASHPGDLTTLLTSLAAAGVDFKDRYTLAILEETLRRQREWRSG